MPVKTGVSDDNYTQIISGVTGNDTVAYDSASVSSDTYYDDGGYEYMTDDTGTDTAGTAAPAENGSAADNTEEAPAEEPAEPEAEPDPGDTADPSEADGVVVMG